MLIYQYNTNTPTFSANITDLSAKKLQKLVKQGYNDSNIGEMYGISRHKVNKMRHQLGITPVKRALEINYDKFDYHYLKILIDEGNSLSQIAKFYQETASRIRRVLKHFGLMTQEATFAAAVKKEELSKLLEEGKTAQEIAEAFYLEDYRTITHLIKKFNLDMPIHKVDKILGINKIANLIFDGMKPEEIAKKYNIDLSTIINRMRASGFDEVYKELYQPHDIPKEEILDLIKKGYSTSEMAEMYHCSLHQLVQYMVKNKILNTDIPVKKLIKSIEQGMSITDIALKHEVYKNRVPQILEKNNLKTLGQIRQTTLPKEIVEDKIVGCKTYKELAARLGVSSTTAKSLVTKYGLKLEREIVTLPDIKAIKRIMETYPKASVDELASILEVEIPALERVIRQNNIKIYTPHKIHDYNSFEFAQWISYHLEHGDSPVQLGELMGISSARARKIVEKISEEYKDQRYLIFPKIPKNKFSPNDTGIMRKVAKYAREYYYPKNSYNYSQTHLARNFLKVQICKEYNISDTTLEYLINKYNLNESIDTYIKIMTNRA